MIKYRSFNVAIVGGGLIGCSCGHFLTQRGATVTVIEKRFLASGASGANAGHLSIGPVAPQKAVKLFKENRRVFQEDLKGRIDDFEYVHGGYLYVAFDEIEEKELIQKAEILGSHGIEAELLRNEKLQKLEPVLNPVIISGLYIPSTGHFNPFLLNHALARSILKNGGSIHQGVDVNVIEPKSSGFLIRSSKETFEADAVVLATGWEAKDLALPLGLSLPVVPGRGQIIITEPLPALTNKIIMTLKDKYVRQTMSGTFQLGSQLELLGNNKSTSFTGLREIAQKSSEIVPFFKKAKMLRAYAGLRPLSPDSMAIVGEAPGIKGLMLACGHSRTGASMSALTGKVVADLLIEGQTQVDISLWNPERFDEKN